jgi:hypothetical protein
MAMEAEAANHAKVIKKRAMKDMPVAVNLPIPDTARKTK